MKSVSELTDFYYRELYPQLAELEKTRLGIISQFKFYGAIGAVIFVLCGLWIYKTYDLFHLMLATQIIVALIVGSSIYKMLTRDYTKEFKERIITPLIGAIDPKLEYAPYLFLPRHLFERSALFNHSIDRYGGNDCVKGMVNDIAIEFSDIHAEYQTRDSRGRSEWHTLFRGLFLVAEFNKNFKNKTIILPDLAEKVFGNWIGGWLQSINLSRDKVIQLDDSEFEKQFVVYGNDPIETRYILTHSMMKRIVDFQKKIAYPVCISFVQNHIHVAVNTGKDLFEASVFTSLLDYKQAMEYVQTLQHTIGIVEELKLNEKLWSKI